MRIIYLKDPHRCVENSLTAHFCAGLLILDIQGGKQYDLSLSNHSNSTLLSPAQRVSLLCCGRAELPFQAKVY